MENDFCVGFHENQDGTPVYRVYQDCSELANTSVQILHRGLTEMEAESKCIDLYQQEIIEPIKGSINKKVSKISTNP